jgi:hypothetical protein
MASNRAGKLCLLFAISLLALSTHPMKADTPSGIEGTVTVSPIHGGPSRMGVPDSAPLANASFFVESAAGQVATFTTDEKGHFKIGLPPGRYAIRAQKSGMRGRRCGLEDIEVTASGFKQVDLQCDTGLR